jgi:hypothetical protein
MSWLLVVQPDRVQADVLCNALRAHVPEEIAVAESIEGALSSIEQDVPAAVLLSTLIPEVEDHLIAYLGAIPGAGHVQILGLPRLDVGNKPVPRQTRSLFPWRWRPPVRDVEPPACAPDVFARDVAAYLASARALRQENEFYRVHAAPGAHVERRRERRFTSEEVPWISTVRLDREEGALIDVSSRGARLRTDTRPGPHSLKRFDSTSRSRPHLVLELESSHEVYAPGRVIRCTPIRADGRTQYEVTFSFDASVGLHLPVRALPSGLTDTEDDPLLLPPSRDRK